MTKKCPNCGRALWASQVTADGQPSGWRCPASSCWYMEPKAKPMSEKCEKCKGAGCLDCRGSGFRDPSPAIISDLRRQLAALKEKLWTTRDGVGVGRGDTVYYVDSYFTPGEPSPSAKPFDVQGNLVAMPRHRGAYRRDVAECFSTPEVAEAAEAAEAARPEAVPA